MRIDIRKLPDNKLVAIYSTTEDDYHEAVAEDLFRSLLKAVTDQETIFTIKVSKGNYLKKQNGDSYHEQKP